MIALIAGLIYLQQKNDQDSIQNFSGAIFFAITFSSFNSLTSALFVSKLRIFICCSCISVTVYTAFDLSIDLTFLPRRHEGCVEKMASSCST